MIWSKQPGLLEARASAPVVSRFLTFRSASSRAGSGSTRL